MIDLTTARLRPQITQFKKIGEVGHFKQLQVGAGSNVLKANQDGFWRGATTYSAAPFKVSNAGVLSATGANINGTITATGGSITGDLTVTGSLLSDDGSAFQTKIYSGKVGFLKSGSEKAFIKTASDSASLQCATGEYFYVTGLSGGPIARIDQDGNLALNGSGTKITINSSDGKTDDAYDSAGNKIFTCVGGIITQIYYES